MDWISMHVIPSIRQKNERCPIVANILLTILNHRSSKHQQKRLVTIIICIMIIHSIVRNPVDNKETCPHVSISQNEAFHLVGFHIHTIESTKAWLEPP